MVRVHDQNSLENNNQHSNSFENILNNVFGINIGNQPVSVLQPPEGCEYFYNERGQLFMRKIESNNLDDNQDQLAEQEHVQERYSMRMTDKEIEEKFGIGIRLYFNFCNFLIKANFGLSFYH